nr:uncharacterized protein LOC109155335 [Ipomoea batatas]GMC90973.1 uncharacterized protein LOC109155335 [Ipomoea batatas]
MFNGLGGDESSFTPDQEHAEERQVEAVQSPEQDDNTEQDSEDGSSEEDKDEEFHIRSLPSRLTKPIGRLSLAQQQSSVHIIAADVAATFRLPMGHIEITRRTARAVPEILKEWRGIFEKTTACITLGAMTTKMLEAEADDP